MATWLSFDQRLSCSASNLARCAHHMGHPQPRKVQVFSDRLKAGDPALSEEHERAYRIVMVEGAW